MSTRWLSRLGEILLLALAASCGGGGPGPEAGTGPPEGTRTTSVITSRHTGISYTYQVFLPAGYAQGTARYPVVYAADGEYRFPVLSSAIEASRRNLILVNVWHMGTSRRFVDFTLPGAEAYHRFLTQELVPEIDALYRTDVASRAYSGHSLSGEFALFALFLERPGQRTFNTIISGEGSFWARPDGSFDSALGDTGLALEREMFTRDRSLPVTLVLAGDILANGPRVAQVHDYLAARGYTGLRLDHRSYGLGHLPMDGPSFIDALAFAYGP
ncbi:MAG: alpha/beta hydrolase-fold protein [Usitatibacter sp.]